MLDALRDKTRDKLAAALQEIGINAKLAERKQPEEKIEDSWFQRSLGLIEITGSPIRWINILKKDRQKNNPPQWWVVFCIPDERQVPEYKTLNIRSIRKKSVPVIGRVVDVTWKGNDHGTGLNQSLTYDDEVRDMVMKTGNLTIHSYTKEFNGWTVQVDRKVTPSYQDWTAMLKIVRYVLESPRMY